MSLLRDIQAKIERRRLSNGGWTSGSGRNAAIETTCYALMALHDRPGSARDDAIDFLLRTQNRDGGWPAFDGDDPKGCWTTALVLITLRFVRVTSAPIDQSLVWLLNKKGREGHWFWKWKFRTVDRAVRFNPDKFGWSWFPDTVSWVVPTAFSLVALQQSFPDSWPQQVTNRIQLGREMLRDRACPLGGWNAGNGIVFEAALTPHIDTTAIALLALTQENDSAVVQALHWLRQACMDCPSAYSLAWSAIAFCLHHDQALNRCIVALCNVLSTPGPISDIENLSLAAIALNAAEGNPNPFRTG